MNRRSFLTLFGATAALSACGFRLRGSGGQATLPFQTIHIPNVGNAGVAFELRRMILASAGTEVVANPKDAQAIVEILGETRDRGTVTLNTQGRIREYTLTYRVRFQVRRPSGQILLPPTEIALKRELSYNESQAIAKEREEDQLFRNMQSDAVQQILRRIAAIKQA